jgi:hypothetical protein
MHMPALTSVTVAPETVQTEAELDAKETASAEDAVELTTKGAAPKTLFDRAPNVIVCGAGVTATDIAALTEAALPASPP